MSAGRHGRRRRTSPRRDERADLLALAIMVVIVGGILFPVFRGRRGYRQDLCAANLIAIRIAARVYADDNDGALPTADAWSWQLLGGYLSDAEGLKCPRDDSPAIVSYAMNPRYSAAGLHKYRDAEDRILFFDADEHERPEPRHDGWTYCVYLDGDIGFAERNPTDIERESADTRGTPGGQR